MSYLHLVFPGFLPLMYVASVLNLFLTVPLTAQNILHNLPVVIMSDMTITGKQYNRYA